MTERIGQQLGNYQLLRLLGRGGFADVYLGEHVYLSKPAALKVLRQRLGEQESEQFLREARTLARLEHPHIVRVLDFAVLDGLPFLVMDYAVGGTLRTRHPAGTRLPLELILVYVSQVASALQHAHDQRLIHRDVKPENMLLGAREQVLLADFGLALLLPTHPASTQALDPALAGTAPYLAPEQVQGQPGPAGDQYALGVVVYEWLCGQRPFRGTPIEVAMQHISAPPPSLHEQVPELSPAVEEVVLRALAKEPEERFPSVQDFATALQHAAYPARDAHSIPAMPPASLAAVPAVAMQQQAQAQTVTTPGAAEMPAGEREQQDTSGARPAAEPLWKVPAIFTSLVGRAQEVAAICTLLARPEVRLLTLLGVGGIGKTRLAIQVATQLRERFAAGICFVCLAPISDPDLVVPTIAQTLDVKESGARPMQEQLQAFLKEKQMLLVLDNFEQVVTAAPKLSDLLAACSNLKLLVTSRQVLRLSAEHEFAVPPLSLPDLKHLPDLVTLSRYEAVALFIVRAQAARPEFQLTNATAPAVAEICARLDGLPLAIELAAARIKLLPPQALLARLGHRLAVLTGGVRDAPARQQTLRNTIAWSYDLLTTEEQRLFRRLSVFVGGCTLEAVEAVCADLDGAKLGGSILDGIGSLVDKSLVQQIEQEGQDPRLLLLETIREYGLETLAASGEMELTRHVHAQYYLALAEEAEPELEGPQQAMWFDRLERDLDNLRAALNSLLEPGKARESIEMALRLATALYWFWLIRAHIREGWIFLERALERSEGIAGSVRAKAFAVAGHLAGWLDNRDRGEALCQQSLVLFREAGDTAGLGNALFNLGMIAFNSGDLAAARSRYEESLVPLKEVGNKNGIAFSLLLLSALDNFQGEYTKGRSNAEASLLLFRELGNKWGIAVSLQAMAEGFLYEGDADKAHPLLEESLALNKETGDKVNEGLVLGALGQVAFLRGNMALARSLLEEGVTNFPDEDNVDTQGDKAWTLARLAQVIACEGDDARARTLYEQGLAIVKPVDFKIYTPFYLEGLAGVVSVQGELPWAARLWGAAEALRETQGTPLPPVHRAEYERSIAITRIQLGEQVFAAAWAEGRTMTLEQVLAAQGPVTMSTTAPAGSSSIPHAAQAPTYPAGLTAREVEVLRLVAQGLSDAQVAEQLVISSRTVNWHLTSIYSKLEVSSRAAATRYAIEHHVV